MRRLALFVTLAACHTAALAPTAAAKQLVANVVSMPSDLQPGTSVPLIFKLYVLEPRRGSAPIAHPITGTGAHIGVLHAAVVVTNEQGSRAYEAEPLGGGRYSTQIMFPTAGEWQLTVEYEDADPVLLGKGAVLIDEPSADGAGGVGAGLALGGLTLVCVGAAAVFGRRRRSARPRR